MDDTSAGLSLLIVEDHEMGRDLLRELLQLEGHRVSLAEDGTSALQAVETGQFDAALIDIGLPDMSGYDVARGVRSFGGGDMMLLVALTGHGRAEDRRAVRDAGFDAHVVKPIDMDRLKRVLAR